MLLALCLTACGDGAPSPPPAGYDMPVLTGRVVDRADLLPPTDEAAIMRQLSSLERSTGHQMVVVTVPALGAHDIEDYARTLGNWWGIGRAQHDDGILLVVAPTERKVRIEVGRGLETIVRNDEADRVIQQAILPAFRRRDMAAGIHAGVDRLIDELEPEGPRS